MQVGGKHFRPLGSEFRLLPRFGSRGSNPRQVFLTVQSYVVVGKSGTQRIHHNVLKCIRCLNSKNRLVKTLVYSIFLYDSEAWTIRAANRKRIGGGQMPLRCRWCQRGILRNIMNSQKKKTEGDPQATSASLALGCRQSVTRVYLFWSYCQSPFRYLRPKSSCGIWDVKTKKELRTSRKQFYVLHNNGQ